MNMCLIQKKLGVSHFLAVNGGPMVEQREHEKDIMICSLPFFLP